MLERLRLDWDRRQLLLACGASLSFPTLAYAAQAVGPQFAPEAFGAAGDGKSDDYEAFARLVAAVNVSRGGSIALGRGRTYYIGRHVAAGSGVADLTLENCDGVTIEGNGALISVKGDFHRDDALTRGLAGLRFDDCRRVAIRNLGLSGNVDRTTRSPGLAEAPSHGLHFQSCSDVEVDRVTVRHFAADGLYIRQSKQQDPSGARQASRRFAVRNSQFLFNARQGLSIIQLRDAIFDNCDFSYTGYVDSFGNSGPYGVHSPGAGVDIEPHNAPNFGEGIDVLTGDVVFRRCRMTGNHGATFVACLFLRGRRFLERIRLESCHLECNDGLTGGRDGFIFDVPGGYVADCTLQMRDKTAYLGWYPSCDASFEFVRNQLLGRNPQPNHPILAVRPTRGAPVIEGNRIVGEHIQPKPALRSGSWLVFVDNPNAVLRGNRFILPAAAYPRSVKNGAVAAVYANVRLMEANIYETDLEPDPDQARSSYFGIAYTTGAQARGEIFRGTRPGFDDTVRPIDHVSGQPWRHNTRSAWSK